MTVPKALSSEVSWWILESLMGGESGEQDLCKSLSLEPAVVRPHLAKLVEAGIIATRERAPSSGKVAIYYLPGGDKSVGFPPRNYFLLSEALVTGLVRSLGEESVKLVLWDIGVRIGEDTAQHLNWRFDVQRWDPRTYADHIVKGFLAEMQTYPELISVRGDGLVYDQRNCLFQDLAMKYPGLICDVLDEAVHEGMDRKLGDMKTIRLNCRGHGDPACRFRVEWSKAALRSKVRSGAGPPGGKPRKAQRPRQQAQAVL